MQSIRRANRFEQNIANKQIENGKKYQKLTESRN